MICDIHARLKKLAEAPVKRVVGRAEEGTSSHKLKDGRRISCKVKAPQTPTQRLFFQWYIDGLAVDETIVKVALSNE